MSMSILITICWVFFSYDFLSHIYGITCVKGSKTWSLLMSLSLSRSVGVPNTHLCVMNWRQNNNTLSWPVDTHKNEETECVFLMSLFLTTWFSTLDIKRLREQRKRGEERRRGQGFCVSSSESSFSNEAESTTQGSFVPQLFVYVCVCVYVLPTPPIRNK